MLLPQFFDGQPLIHHLVLSLINVCGFLIMQRVCTDMSAWDDESPSCLVSCWDDSSSEESIDGNTMDDADDSQMFPDALIDENKMKNEQTFDDRNIV